MSAQDSRPVTTALPPSRRALLVLLLPPAGGWLALQLLGGSGPAPLFGGLGLVSWFLALNWYRLRGVGLRGGRPLFAGIAFAVMGWVVVLVARLAAVTATDLATGGLGRIFLFLLLFEAFAVNLWAFGILFRAVADWRGAPVAALVSGVIFGVTGFLTFGEAHRGVAAGLVFFLLWGGFYALVRLRSGSLLGLVPVQAMQTLTVWHFFVPPQPPDSAELTWYYLGASLLFLILIWRLWPRLESDYRV